MEGQYQVNEECVQSQRNTTSQRSSGTSTRAIILNSFSVIANIFRYHHHSSKFFYLYENFGPNMTLKVHVIIDHYKYVFEKSGTTMRHSNGEFTESCHSTLRKSEETHGFKVVKKCGTPVHEKKSLQSLVFFNSRRAGYSTPQRLRKSSPRVTSPLASPRSSSPLASPRSSSPLASPRSSSPFASQITPLASSSSTSSPLSSPL